jgi:hypothetical protein
MFHFGRRIAASDLVPPREYCVIDDAAAISLA